MIILYTDSPINIIVRTTRSIVATHYYWNFVGGSVTFLYTSSTHIKALIDQEKITVIAENKVEQRYY